MAWSSLYVSMFSRSVVFEGLLQLLLLHGLVQLVRIDVLQERGLRRSEGLHLRLVRHLVSLLVLDRVLLLRLGFSGDEDEHVDGLVPALALAGGQLRLRLALERLLLMLPLEERRRGLEG